MARPREFDRQDVLGKAMEVFWTHGYEGTSMSDLVIAMGLKKGSIYQAFGDKHSLFLEALTTYVDDRYRHYQWIARGPHAPIEKLKIMLTNLPSDEDEQEKTIRMGCFSTNTQVELAPHDGKVKELLESHTARIESLLAEIVKQGQDTGQICTDQSSEDIAISLNILRRGIMVDRRLGTDMKRVETIAELYLAKLAP